MRRALLVALIVGYAAVGAPAQQGYSVTQTVTLPRTSYVGDRIELRVGIRPSGSVSVTEPEAMPQASWAEFHNLSVIRRSNEYELRLVLTPYEPGTLTLPPIDLGDIEIRELNVHVSSVLEDAATEPAPPYRQAVLPYTRILIGGLAAVLLVVPLGFFAVARWGHGRIRQVLAVYRTRRPYRKILKTLRALESRIEELEARRFYIDLLQELRRYFSEKLDRDLMSATTAEIESYLRQVLPQVSDREALVELFRYGDLVKFASRKSRLGERRAHINELRRVLDRVERSAGTSNENTRNEEACRVGA